MDNANLPYDPPVTPAELKRWRTIRGIKQAALAKVLRVTSRTIYAWESGAWAVPQWLTAPALESAASNLALPVCHVTHRHHYKYVRRYSASTASRRRFWDYRHSHPIYWGLTGDHATSTYKEVFTDLDDNPLDIREVAHLPSGTVVKRDGLNWVVP